MTAHAWTTRTVPVFSGIGESHIMSGEDYATRTLGELFEMPPARRPKLHGPAFIPSTYNSYDARCHAVQQERGAYIALTGDIDNGDHALAQIERRVRGFVGGAAWLIYSSPHSRPGDRRWRVILPLNGIVGFARWHDAQHAFFAALEAQGLAMDHVMARAGQHVYLPNVPDRHSKTGEPLRGADGNPLYFQHATSGTSASGLRLDSGPISEGIAAIGQQRADDERKRERIRASAAERRARQPHSDRASIIDEFNARTPIATLLEMHGYQQSPRNSDDWRSPMQTGDSYATRIVADKWISLSGSDAGAGLGCRCSSGCFGDAFDLMLHFEHGGDHRAAFQQLRREREVARLQRNQAALVASASAKFGSSSVSDRRGHTA